MLADRRATRFMNDFVGQWLQVRNINGQAPDGALFAGFNDTLRKAMVRETELFFESQVREDRPIPELLRADYTYLNERLARHYGVSGVYGSRFRRVTWPDDRRHGLLGQASVLTVTSYANRTSVVLRGKWVLETLLGAPPPPPPPNVPPLPARAPRQPDHVCASGCSSTAPIRSARAVTRRWIRWGSRWRTSMRSGGGARPTGGAASTPTIALDGSDGRQPEGVS